MRLMPTAALALLLVSPASPAGAQLAPPNDLGVTFAHVHLNVADIEVHKRLWVEHFDGVVVQKGPLVTVKFPNFFIILTQQEPSGPSQGTVMDHFGFKVRSTSEIVEAWRAAGLEVQSEFTGAEGFPNAYLLAPDGVRVELQEDPAQTVKAEGYHIHYWHPDFESLMAWYAEAFGADIRPRGSIQTTADLPGQNLSFATCRGECVATQGRAIDHVGFEVEDIDATVARLKEMGVEFQLEPRHIPSIELTIAFFVDPSGVRVELTEGLDQY